MTMMKEERRAKFKADLQEMKIGKKSEQTGNIWQIGGLVTMIVGVVITVVAYVISLGYDNALDVGSMQILAIAGLAISVTGGSSYTAGAVTKAMRLWLLRQLYENHDQTEALVQAIRGDDD